MCGKGFPSEEILEVHFDKHDLPELPEDLEEQCSICHRIFDTDSLLQIHIEKEHRPKEEEDIHVDEWVSQLIMSPSLPNVWEKYVVSPMSVWSIYLFSPEIFGHM